MGFFHHLCLNMIYGNCFHARKWATCHSWAGFSEQGARSFSKLLEWWGFSKPQPQDHKWIGAIAFPNYWAFPSHF